jgi:NADPH:quinone reductase-like Zn-dependent oxidoreductase
MKAVAWTQYGPPEGLQLKEIATPTPKDNEVLIKIHATTVTAGDCEIRTLKLPLFLGFPMRLYFGVLRPKNVILGQELAGEIAAIGKAVTRFHVGDSVIASTGFSFGAYAEYICLAESPEGGVIAPKPATMTYEEAASIPLGGLVALHFLRQAQIKPGQRVLINGAGGAIGTYGVQLARVFGAEVTAVDSGPKLPMLRSIGAQHVIDYVHEDFTRRGQTYDVIFDVVGKSSFSRSIQCLTPEGAYLLGNPKLSHMLRGAWISQRSSKRVIFGDYSQTVDDILFLKDLIDSGKVKSVIDRRYPLSHVADAHRYVDTGQKAGHVIITIDHAQTI